MESLWDSITDAVPSYVVGALAILIIGWLVAWLLSKVVERALRRTGMEQGLGRYLDGRDGAEPNVAGAAGRVVFYVIMLFVVIAVLDRLQLRLATEPMNALLANIFAFIPNLLGALVLALLAYLLAKILRTVVYQLSRTARLDERLQAAERGETEQATTTESSSDTTDTATAQAPDQRFPLSRGLADVAYALVFLIFLPAILDALQLGGLLEPVNELLNTVLGFIPNLVAAGLILFIGWFMSKIISRIVTNFLAGAGFDRLPVRLGIGTAFESVAPGGWTPSRMAGALVLVVLMWFAVIEALEVLGFGALVLLLTGLLLLAARILFGLLIIAIGLWLARFAARAIRGSGVQQSDLLAFAGQAAIVVLFGAMGLRQMGIANSIINLAFAILLGAIGIAVAIAFGLGGRETAGRLVDHWVTNAQTGQLDASARRTREGESPGEGSGPTAE